MGKEEPVQSDSKSFALIKELLTPEVVEEREFLWQDIVAAMMEIVETPTLRAEELLVSLLEMEGRIRLAPESDIPGVMPPEDTLKSIAIETLSKWTGRKYLKAFETLCDRAESPGISTLARIYIEKFRVEPRE